MPMILHAVAMRRGHGAVGPRMGMGVRVRVRVRMRVVEGRRRRKVLDRRREVVRISVAFSMHDRRARVMTGVRIVAGKRVVTGMRIMARVRRGVNVHRVLVVSRVARAGATASSVVGGFDRDVRVLLLERDGLHRDGPELHRRWAHARAQGRVLFLHVDDLQLPVPPQNSLRGTRHRRRYRRPHRLGFELVSIGVPVAS